MHLTHVTEGCNSKPLEPLPLDEHGHCGEQQLQYISAPYMFPLQSCTNVGIMHHNSAHADPGRVDCGGGSSCLLLLHPSSTFFALMLVQMFAPCLCSLSISWC